MAEMQQQARSLYEGVNKLYAENATSDLAVEWHRAPDEDVHRYVIAVAERIDKDMAGRRLEWLDYGRLYAGRDFKGFDVGEYQRAASTGPTGKNVAKLTLNVIKSCVDTAQAKIASKKPRAMFLTKGGDWKLRERGKLATKYCDGAFAATDCYAVARRAFVDCAVFGTGNVKVFTEDGQIKVERVLVNELLVDEDDGRYGDPTQIHQRKYVPLEKALATYGKTEQQRKEIMNGARLWSPGSVVPTVRIVESWKRPSSKGADDGRHTICVAGCTLFAEKWKHDWFPIISLRWSEPLLGFYGIGLAEELVGLQIEINKVLRQIARAIEGCVPRVFLKGNAKLSPGSLTDQIWSIVRYNGDAPTFSTPSALTPEVAAHLAMLYAKAYEISGVSQMSAQSKKEPGLDSGVAIRDFNDIGTERFLPMGQRFEEFFMRISKVMLDLTRDLAQQDPKLSIKVKDGKNSRDLRWLKDINLEEDEYLLQAYPVAFLPTTPAGKLAYIQDLIKTGAVQSRERILQLLDYPDLEEFLSMETIGLDHAQRSIARILDDGVYVQPTKFMNLDLCALLAQAAVLQGDEDGRPQDRLDMLTDFADACSALSESLKPPPAAMPGGPPGAPGAAAGGLPPPGAEPMAMAA